jgi:hypothetical protein
MTISKKSLMIFIFGILCMSFLNADYIIFFLGDPHTFSDADKNGVRLEDERLRKLRLNGEYVNMFVSKLLKDPEYEPQGEEKKLMNGYSLATAIAYMIKNENPDLVIVGGDYHPIGMSNLWAGFGLKSYGDATNEDIIEYKKIFDRYVHNVFSRIPCEIKFVRGNHDVPPAMKDRGVKWKNPAGDWTECIEIIDNGFTAMIMILDSESGNRKPIEIVEDFTIGDWQKEKIKLALEKNKSATHKIFVQHKVFGGWPGSAGGNFLSKPQAIGQAFTPADYQKLEKDTGILFSTENIDQCWLTDLFLREKVDLSMYAHNHIFHDREVSGYSHTTKFVCMGATKYSGEKSWWETFLWSKYYGSWEAGDFWGCGGITKVILNVKKITIEYIKTSMINRTNIPKNFKVGAILEKHVIMK